MAKSNLESKGFVLLTLRVHITAYHCRNSRQEPRVRTEAEAMEEHWLALNGFFSPLSYATQGHLARGDTPCYSRKHTTDLHT